MAYKLQPSNDSNKSCLCDAFLGFVKASDLGAEYNGGDYADTDIDIFEYLAQFNSLNYGRYFSTKISFYTEK